MYQNTPLKTMPKALRLAHRYVQSTPKDMETLKPRYKNSEEALVTSDHFPCGN